MDLSNVVVVVPTIRETHIKNFIQAWQFPCPVIVVEDNPEPSFDLPGVAHYSWQDIERDLGADSWIIPRRTDCVRSYGYWKAYQTGAEYIITLDDDCLPLEKPGADYQHTTPLPFKLQKENIARAFVQSHVDNLTTPFLFERWWSTLDGIYPRGFPYERYGREFPIGISHGLWTNVLDRDSITQLYHGRGGSPPYEYRRQAVPFGSYYPMCGMNLAWRREYTPLMYFLLMGQDKEGRAYPFDRFGDIWAGILSKKVLDHLGVAVYSGQPYVNHSRASNVWANFDKEHAGIKANETFWQWIDAIHLSYDYIPPMYRQLADEIQHNGDYWRRLARAMMIWSTLYD